ncbi:hypothetical protein ELE00_32355, partial [Klebsiella pneumoniae]|nr:hypothetical protein [Klebsiella pneumoniae]
MSLKNNFKTHKSVNCSLVLCHCNQPLSLFFSCQVPCRRLCVRRKEGEFEIEQMVSFASLSEEDRRSDTMKDKDEQTAL